MPLPMSPHPSTPTRLMSAIRSLAPAALAGARVVERFSHLFRDPHEGMGTRARPGPTNLVALEPVEHLLHRCQDALVVGAVDSPDGDDRGQQYDGRQQSQRPERHNHGGNGKRSEAEHHAAREDPPLAPRPNVGGQRDGAESRLELRHLARDFVRVGQRVSPAFFPQCALNAGERTSLRFPGRAVGVAPLHLQRLFVFHPARERALDRGALAGDDTLRAQPAGSREPGPQSLAALDHAARLLFENGLLEIAVGNPDVFAEREDFVFRQSLADLALARLQPAAPRSRSAGLFLLLLPPPPPRPPPRLQLGRPLDDALQGIAADQLPSHQTNASTMTAAPCPPPMQAEPRPNRFFSRRSACNRWIVMRVPLAASGCPIAIAPPHAFVRARSRPSSRSTARYCGANASFTSTRSICSSFIPAFASALRAAGAGPMPMYLGSTPATAHATRRPSGFRPCALAYSSLAITVAAPPSEMPDALPAVTSPSFLK